MQVEYVIIPYTPHSSNCFTSGKDVVIIVVLMQMMGNGKTEGIRVWMGRQDGYYRYYSFSICLVFGLLLIVLSRHMHNGCCVCFFVPVFVFLSLVPLIRHYYFLETVLVAL